MRQRTGRRRRYNLVRLARSGFKRGASLETGRTTLDRRLKDIIGFFPRYPVRRLHSLTITPSPSFRLWTSTYISFIHPAPFPPRLGFVSTIFHRPLRHSGLKAHLTVRIYHPKGYHTTPTPLCGPSTNTRVSYLESASLSIGPIFALRSTPIMTSVIPRTDT